ncbi:Aste57867_23653 [Aphanomyces stellatus]|uniref:Aste57867_23653 protein n=1 Tax=Aphanomyces stellatus TaxID=120398 RepID=A0A485LSS4_9STRA|nr:hypothetical protein As57867_023581 [Aphanomyces stellatus]VFU00298.1 Aste57867_23653 [Aphanomyces stellatus]
MATMQRIDVTSFEDAIPQLKDHLASVVIDEDDPAVLFKWNMVAMPLFLDAVNLLVAGADGNTAFPLWMQTFPPAVTFTSLTDDMFLYLATNPVNALAPVILAPNTLAAYTSIIGRMTRVEYHPFVQEAMAAVPPGMTLATTYFITDRTIVNFTPTGLSPSQPPFLQVFA